VTRMIVGETAPGDACAQTVLDNRAGGASA
jgi:hypothetical protein